MKNTQTAKKKGRSSKFLIATAIIILSLSLVAGGIWVYGKFFVPAKDPATTIFYDLSEKYDEVDYDENTKTPYINNEVIILAEPDVKQRTIKSIVSEYDGYIAEAMDDIGVYKIKFDDSYELKKLEKIAKNIAENESVSGAYISTVCIFDEDATSEPKLPIATAVYPEDPWGSGTSSANWDDTPEGSNWSLEAINAPEAWGYLDQLDTVKVGLVDSMVDMSHRDLTVSGAFAALTDTETGKTVYQSITNRNFTAAEHGTHVAGTMMATWNSSDVSGIMGDKGELYYGVAYNVNDGHIVSEYTTPYNYFRAIKLLVDQDVQAINISQNTSRLIGFAASQGNDNAIDYLSAQAEQAEALLSRLISQRQADGKKDFVLCISAGNSNNTPYFANEDTVYGYEEYNPYNPLHTFKNAVIGNSEACYNNYLALIDSEEVMDRIIVVGSVGMTGEDRYSYSEFSCVGERVDIVAPGENVYSIVPGNTTKSLSGTSMSAPHVTAAAGLVFAGNSDLSGPEVKRIICASTNGRYYHGDDYSGLLDLNQAIRNSLLTRESSVGSIVNMGGSGLDLCFVVDTTGSMGDDIDNAKENMKNIISSLQEKTSDYRVALIDYRDFSYRGYSYDYPAMIQFDFTNDNEEIISGINDLSLGNGGDNPETVYSGLAETLKLNWRDRAQKVIIILGDAEPLDPEPETGYTYDIIAKMLYEADLYIDVEDSDDRVLGDAEDSLISVYSIGTSASSDAADFFEKISSDTGGAYTETENASEVSDAIMDSIEQIKLEYAGVTLNFGAENSNETVEIYQDGDYAFSIQLDEAGQFLLENIDTGEYEWKITRLQKSGDFEIEENSKRLTLEAKGKWFTFALVLWQRHRVITIIAAVGAVLLLIAVIIAVRAVKKAVKNAAKKKKSEKNTQVESTNVADSKQPEIPNETKTVFCVECGSPISSDAKFCENCGVPVNHKK